MKYKTPPARIPFLHNPGSVVIPRICCAHTPPPRSLLVQPISEEGDKIYIIFFNAVYGRSVLSANMLEASLLGVGTVIRLQSDAWSMSK